MPAFLETVIHFEFGDLLSVFSPGRGFESGRSLAVVGPHTHAGINLQFEGTIDSFAIFLQPAALWSLFRVPASVVAELHCDAVDVLGAPVVELGHVMAEAACFAERIRAAEAFLLRAANCSADDTAITVAASLLARRGGKILIQDLAGYMHLSVRELERSFLREMGISPKRFARVARFQDALDARVGQPERSWLDIAISSGYHDQMHLVHEFESLSGLTPTVTVQRLGDSRPSALAASRNWSSPE